MKKPEDLLVRGEGRFIHCVDYEQAVQAMYDYARHYRDLYEQEKARREALEKTVSDEEINSEAMVRMASFKLTPNPFHGLSEAFADGATWMREKLTRK